MSITPNGKRMPDRGRQQGQSSVFVIVFLGITILSLVFLYKAGKLTSEKMELQNAADAAAYSVALLEARDLNFMAYTNRAMIANEVAVGQAVGLAAMPRHWRSIGHYIDPLCGARIEPLAFALGKIPLPPFPIIGQVIENICSKVIRNISKFAFIEPGKLMTKIIDAIAKVMAIGMHASNIVLSEAQTLVHFGTIAYVVTAIDEVKDDNAKDTQLSPYGLNLLLGHLHTYGSLNAYLPFATGKFTRTYHPNKAKDAAAFERLAAITTASRDEFTKQGGAKFNIIDMNPSRHHTLSMGQDLGFDPNVDFDFWAIPRTLKFYVHLDMTIKLGIARLGGSELRYIDTKAQGDKFNWSSGSTSSGGFKFGFRIKITAEACDPTGTLGCTIIGSLDMPINIKNHWIKIDGQLQLGAPINTTIPITIPLSPFPTDIPWGASGAQIGKTQVTTDYLMGITEKPFPKNNPYFGAPNDNASHKFAWDNIPNLVSAAVGYFGTGGPDFSCDSPATCTVPVVNLWMPNERVDETYNGLKKFSDTLKPQDLWGFEGPNNIIALEKKADDLFSATAPEPTGQFQLKGAGKMAEDIMGSLAKGEVYFKRSSQVPYFKRTDGFEEYGSAFNPYWQARLAPLSHADRTVATLQQHKVDLTDASLTPFINYLGKLIP
jgi:Putative Flp pilus-assembly TadE/G-like